ncbi:MAG: flagellar basal body-associated FliL family protein [Acidovorax sp.]
MATKNEPAKAQASGKKKIVIIAVVALVAIVGGAAALLMMRHGGDEEGAAPQKAAKVAPTFLSLENMVVNLADPGGDRFIQLGVTLELADAKALEEVKQYLPAIRSGILLLLSQRSSQELMTREGKDKLADDILREVSRPLGYKVPKKRKPASAEAAQDEDSGDETPAPKSLNPVRKVLFSSFIIQ